MSTENGRGPAPVYGDCAPDLSIVVPCLNEEEILEQTYDRVRECMDGLGTAWEIVFVDDGSTDRSPDLLRELATRDRSVRVVRLSRSFGHQIALSAGLDHALGRAVVLIDADLQDPPELIGKLCESWREGFDVVYGVRRRREGEPWSRRVVTDVFYRVLARLSPFHPPERAADFRLLDRRVVDLLRGMPEPDRYLRGMVAWLGLRQTALVYDRRPRIGGRRKYNVAKLSQLAMNGLVCCGPNLLRGGAAAGCALSLAAAVICALFGALKGSEMLWIGALVATISVLHFLYGLLLGEYVGRLLNLGLGRPLYVVEERMGFEAWPPSDRHAARQQWSVAPPRGPAYNE